ncbi:flocculation protein FLO11-like, partial [Orussus abietinus]|uniref:flocculation protein FLO11-like n=1 Tax=Orussus abietinus TaxID=222816 RepID=UPI000C7161C9
MGSSTASETTINTSTDSANTMVTTVTTTDGEQPDDSLDLIDGFPEMSPPPVTTHSQSGTTQTPSRANSGYVESTPASGTKDAQHSTAPGGQAPSSNHAVDSPGAPPPTPMIGTHQESRFTFTSGRTPPLPDLKVTDFFSTPVRGSVDAGQPDANHINSMLSLVAAKERQNASESFNGISRIQQSSDKGTSESKSGQKNKPNINVTTNPLDISLCGGQPSCTPHGSTGSRGRGRSTECHPLVSPIHSWVRLFFPFCALGTVRPATERSPGPSGGAAGTKRSAQATIVVQQPSLSLDAPAATILLRPDADNRRREDNMRQLLDVTNTLTLQDIHDFEM